MVKIDGVKLILPPAVKSPAALREQERLDALASYNVLDTSAEESFDRLTRVAKLVFNVSMSTVTFIDGHRQWFKSRDGVESCETGRAPALCNVAIQLPEALIVPDAAADERFAHNPFVTGEPNIRFYAGTQQRSSTGQAVGTLCAMDTRPRAFSVDEAKILNELGGLATDLLELRRQASPSNVADLDLRGTDANAVLKAGRLYFNKGKTKVDINCTVRSLSRSSAAVDVLSTAGIPDRLALVIEADATSRLCDIASKSERRLVLSFES